MVSLVRARQQPVGLKNDADMEVPKTAVISTG